MNYYVDSNNDIIYTINLSVDKCTLYANRGKHNFIVAEKFNNSQWIVFGPQYCYFRILDWADQKINIFNTFQ